MTIVPVPCFYEWCIVHCSALTRRTQILQFKHVFPTTTGLAIPTNSQKTEIQFRSKANLRCIHCELPMGQTL